MLLTVILAGCAPPYRVTLPTLEGKPVPVLCRVDGRPRGCLVVVADDFQALVRELKAACLALGGTRQACQAED